jgi:hypothetical protein
MSERKSESVDGLHGEWDLFADKVFQPIITARDYHADRQAPSRGFDGLKQQFISASSEIEPDNFTSEHNIRTNYQILQTKGAGANWDLPEEVYSLFTIGKYIFDSYKRVIDPE